MHWTSKARPHRRWCSIALATLVATSLGVLGTPVPRAIAQVVTGEIGTPTATTTLDGAQWKA
jgi:hypothetical protein